MNKTNRIGLAVGLGTVIGAAFGLSLDALIGRLIWLNALLGAALGGGFAYLAYDFAAILRAIPKAWREATKLEQWQLSQEKKHEFAIFGKSAVCAAMGMSCVFATLMPAILLPKLLLTGVSLPFLLDALVIYAIVTAWGSLLMALAPTFAPPSRRESEYRALKRVCQDMARLGNPLTVYGYLPPRGTVWLIKHSPRYLHRFTKYLFLEIHSDERLLCLADAALFAAVAYFVATPLGILLSALAGAVFGALNYEVVSKRWMKLVPQH